MSLLHTAANADVIFVQAGEAARALRGYLGNQLAGAIYLAFVQHHLTVRSPTDKTVEVVMAFGNALVDLISAVPDASAPADQRLDRSPFWCTSGRHQSGSDMLFLPLKHQAGAADMAPGMEAFQQAPGKDVARPAALPEIVNLTRVQALNLFLSGVKPPDGPCLAILQDRSRPEEQRLAALQILITFYGCNYNPIIADAHSATYACRSHFEGFTDAYASENLQLSRLSTLLLQVCAQCWIQLAKQDNLQLLSFSLDCISCTCHCWSGILHSRLLLGSQKSLFPKGKHMSFIITPKVVKQ